MRMGPTARPVTYDRVDALAPKRAPRDGGVVAEHVNAARRQPPPPPSPALPDPVHSPHTSH